MKLSRRRFLAAPVALGSTSLAGGIFVQRAWNQDTPPTVFLVLHGRMPFDAAFVGGAIAGCAKLGYPTPHIMDVDLGQADSFTRLRTEFRRRAGGSVIGLLDHGTAKIVEQALLDCRVAIVCSGDHAGSRGTIRHRLAVNPSLAEIATEQELTAAHTRWPYWLGYALTGAGKPESAAVVPKQAFDGFSLISFSAIL